jgi:hypothetical protein
MRRIDYRILVGAALILGGVLALLDQIGVLKGATSFFWAGILAFGAVVFLLWFFSDRSRWWAAIPGFALAGLAASTLLLDRIGWGGFAFLVGLGIGFLAVYLSDRSRWWAIIPGGVLTTLGVESAMTSSLNVADTGGVFMLGLGITFLLVALLARMRWAFIPAAVLLLLGFFLGTPFVGALEYVWIGILFIVGVALVINTIVSK